MHDPNEPPPSLRLQSSLNEPGALLLRRLENLALIVAASSTAIRHGMMRATQQETRALGIIVVAVSAFLTISAAIRYRWSLRKTTFLREQWPSAAFAVLWTAGFAVIQVFGPFLPEPESHLSTRVFWYFSFSEVLVVLLAVIRTVQVTRSLASHGINPAVLLVGSFLVLITVGTLLLMLPRARADYAAGVSSSGAPFLTALFTATSASCVTGLVVEPTGEYWSRFGQTIIMVLFQLGGLGIMTSGALFVVFASRTLQVQEVHTLRKLLESERLSDVPRLLVTILVFTFGAELIGAVLISGLWADEPWPERAFQSLFHAISAFCNAGFALTPDSFVGMAGRWQVWFGVCGLIITGGLGFGVVYNLFRLARHRLRPRQPSDVDVQLRTLPRLSGTSRLVLATTGILLAIGTVNYHVMESFGIGEGEPHDVAWSDSWFQAVTFRTAGFNTVDLAELQTTTKLFGIGMMFIGASPGSTGGGVKTVCVALIFLSIVSLLRGRDRVELGHRRVPDLQIQRAFLIVTLGMAIVMVTTFLLVLFENKPNKLIDHVFEATSAFATVGLSTGITPELTGPSRVVIVIVMFIGRVGPLTLVMALAGKIQKPCYDLPEDRVALG